MTEEGGGTHVFLGGGKVNWGKTGKTTHRFFEIRGTVLELWGT